MNVFTLPALYNIRIQFHTNELMSRPLTVFFDLAPRRIEAIEYVRVAFFRFDEHTITSIPRMTSKKAPGLFIIFTDFNNDATTRLCNKGTLELHGFG